MEQSAASGLTPEGSLLERHLLPYQLQWVRDAARFKIGLWSRQTGKSLSTACEAVRCATLEPGTLWVVLSAGERQALEWMEKAKLWTRIFKLAIADYDDGMIGEALIKQAEIRLENGSRILAIPANPDTARGYSANLVLDEFAIHEKPWDIWAAIYPSITNPLNGRKRLRVVSTPKGRGNKFYDLWAHNSSYSKHKVTIQDAIQQGLPLDLGELKAGADDDDVWAQEFMCEFIDSTDVLLPYETIASCEAPEELLQDDGKSELFVGWDVGRSRDLSVIIVLQRVGDVLHLIRMEELKKFKFRSQLQVLEDLVERNRARVRRVCIDATGIGSMPAEETRERFGAIVEPVTFTAQSKLDMYSRLKESFSDRRVRIPASRALREDLHSVIKNVSASGNISFSAARRDDGHSDRAAALALALHAASVRGLRTRPAILQRASNYLTRTVFSPS